MPREHFYLPGADWRFKRRAVFDLPDEKPYDPKDMRGFWRHHSGHGDVSSYPRADGSTWRIVCSPIEPLWTQVQYGGYLAGVRQPDVMGWKFIGNICYQFGARDARRRTVCCYRCRLRGMATPRFGRRHTALKHIAAHLRAGHLISPAFVRAVQLACTDFFTRQPELF